MSFTTWVRAEDAYGQFDVRKGDDLREGVTLVKNYPEHVAQLARPGKARVELGGAAAGYAGMTKAQLQKDIDDRNAALTEGQSEIVPEGPKKDDLIAALEARDAEPAAAELTESSDAQSSDTGEETTTTDVVLGDAESE